MPKFRRLSKRFYIPKGRHPCAPNRPMKVTVKHYQKGQLIEEIPLPSKKDALNWIRTTKSEMPFSQRIRTKQFFQIQRTINF